MAWKIHPRYQAGLSPLSNGGVEAAKDSSFHLATVARQSDPFNGLLEASPLLLIKVSCFQSYPSDTDPNQRVSIPPEACTVDPWRPPEPHISVAQFQLGLFFRIGLRWNHGAKREGDGLGCF